MAERDPQKLMGDPAHVRADARMVRRATINRWPVPENARGALLAAVTKAGVEAAGQGPAGVRTLLNCVRVLIDADKINVMLTIAENRLDPVEEGTRIIELPTWGPFKPIAAKESGGPGTPIK